MCIPIGSYPHAVLATLCLALVCAQAGDPAPTPTKADVELRLGVRRGLLRYDLELLTARPGARVGLTFANVDDLVHNWVLCRPGSKVDDVAAAALALGTDASRLQFVPKLDAVVAATPLVEPGKDTRIEFVLPDAEGDYPYLCTLPGHAALMRGTLRVGTSSTGLRGLRYACYEGAWQKLPDFAALTPVKQGELTDGLLDLAVASRERDFGLVFTGELQVSKAGRYQFHLDSDDGARLSIGGREVVARDGVHPANQEATGAVELAAGAHAVQVEFFQHHGGRELRVAWSQEQQARVWLSRERADKEAARQALAVLDEAVVARVFVADAPPRAIAVGLPGGVSFCFDPEAGSIAFGWRGGFLDVGPDRAERGGKRCPILGERFEVGDVGFPLAIDGKRDWRWLGYELGKAGPTFLFEVGGIGLRQTVTAAPGGALRSAFAIDGRPRAIEFHCKRAGREVKASAGVWDGDVLRLGGVVNFSVEVK